MNSELDARYLELAKDPDGNREELQRMVDEATGLGRIKHQFREDDKVLVPYPKVAEELYREYYKVNGLGYFSTGKYDETELEYLVSEEGFKIESGVELRKAVTSWLETFVRDKSDTSPDGDLDFWGSRWGMSASQLRAFVSDPVTYDEAGNVIPLSERFKHDEAGRVEPLWSRFGPPISVAEVPVVNDSSAVSSEDAEEAEEAEDQERSGGRRI